MSDDIDFATFDLKDASVPLRHAISIRVLEDTRVFETLFGAWTALAKETPQCALTQTVEWCRLSWQHFCVAGRDTLRILTAWHGPQLIAVWPFRRRREGAAWRVDILGCGIGDISDPLIHPDFAGAELCERLFTCLCAQGDLIELSCLESQSVMARVVGIKSMVGYDIPFEDYIVEPQKWESWDAFIGHYSQKTRHNLRRTRKNLQNTGTVRFEVVKDPVQQREAVDWILRQKQAWFRRRFFHRDWFYAAESQAFLIDILSQTTAIGQVEVFLLKRDDEIAAGVISPIDRRALSGLIITYDPAFHPFSPGMLLVEDMVRWGYERGLILEMGIGKVDFKERWATKVGLRVSHIRAATVIGVLALLPGFMSYTGATIKKNHISPIFKAVLNRDRLNRLKALIARLRGVPRQL